MTRWMSVIAHRTRCLAAIFTIAAASVLPGCIWGPDDSEFGQQLATDYPLGITEWQLNQSLERNGIPRTLAEDSDADGTRRVFADFQGNSMVNRYVEFMLEPSFYSNSGLYFGAQPSSTEHRMVLRGYRVWHSHDAFLRAYFDPRYAAWLYESAELPSGVQRFEGEGYCWYIAPVEGDEPGEVIEHDEEVEIGAMAVIRITWPTDMPHASTIVPIPAELASVKTVWFRVFVGPANGGKRFALHPKGTVLLEGEHVARELNPTPEPEGRRLQAPTAFLFFDDVLTQEELKGGTLTFTFRPETN